MDELFIYDKEKGLFKSILSKSKAIQGRYYVSGDNGLDLNTNNIGSLVQQVADKKYPLCFCVAPRSVISNEETGQEWEEFYFNLCFLRKTYDTMDDRRTNRSTHEVWFDWKDMKTAAADFIRVLNTVTRTRKLTSGRPIATEFNVKTETVNIRRLSRFGEDDASGVLLSFVARLYLGDCSPKEDYTQDDINEIIIPDQIIHEHHA